MDDIHPEIGYGLLKNSDQFSYLKKLNNEFGLKFTLFTVPVWHGRDDMDIRKHMKWLDWIQSEGFYEIAIHGVTHKGIKPEFGAMELYGISEEQTFNILKTSKDLFKMCGLKCKGFKVPGWVASNDVYKHLKTNGFDWIADHILGEDIITLSNGLIQVPYNCNIENLEHAYPNKTAIFHSHISPKEGNKNGWTKELYLSTKNYLIELQKKYKLVPLTFSEYVEKVKNV